MDTLVIGLDAATYNILDILFDESRLPNLSRLIDDGTAGKLRSTIPPATYPAWKCYSTGQHPTKLEFQSFLDFDSGELNPASTDAPEIWDYLSAGGDSAVSINMPTTYPASRIKGFLTSGYVVSGDDWVSPAELRPFLESEFGYKPLVDFPVHTELLADDTAEQRAEMRRLMQSRFDLASFTAEHLDPDFMQMTLYYTDTHQHFFWNDPEILHEMWEFVDERVGNLLNQVGDVNVFVVSDHGFHELESGIFYLNQWLQENGYLKLSERKASNAMQSFGLTSTGLRDTLDRFGLLGLAREVLPESYRRQVPNPRGEVGVDQYLDRIEWEDSTAFFYGGIYLNADRLGSRYMTVRNELADRLEAITSPVTGEPIFERICPPGKVYDTPSSPKNNPGIPDLLVLPRDNAFASPGISGSLWNTEDLRGRWSVHARDGIFIASGPDIKAGSSADLEIFDVAPTILHAMGHSVPDAMDGRVAKEVFEPSSDPATRKVEAQSEVERIRLAAWSSLEQL